MQKYFWCLILALFLTSCAQESNESVPGTENGTESPEAAGNGDKSAGKNGSDPSAPAPEGKMYLDIAIPAGMSWKTKLTQRVKMNFADPGESLAGLKDSKGKGEAGNYASSELDLGFSGLVKPLDKYNNTDFILEFTNLNYQSDLGGKKIHLTTEDTKSPFFPLAGQKFDAEFDRKTGSLKSVGLIPSILSGAGSSTSEADLEIMLREIGNFTFGFLPEKPIEEGDVWETEVELSSFPQIRITRSCTLRSIDTGRLNIIVSGTVTPNETQRNFGFSYGGASYSVSGQEGGYLVVDALTGLILNRQMGLSLQGTQTRADGSKRDVQFEMEYVGETSID